MGGDHREKLGELTSALVKASLDLRMGRLENTASVRVHRKAVARALTAARQREIAEGLPKGSLSNVTRSAVRVGGGRSAADGKRGFLQGVVDRLSESKE